VHTILICYCCPQIFELCHIFQTIYNISHIHVMTFSYRMLHCSVVITSMLKMELVLNRGGNDIILPPSSFGIILLTISCLHIIQQVKLKPITTRKHSRDAQRISNSRLTLHLLDNNIYHNDLPLKYAVSCKLYLALQIYIQNSFLIWRSMRNYVTRKSFC
jgi:hypothetical protein